MSVYNVKVTHIRFLNSSDVAILSRFGIRSRVHNAIYDEHTAHVACDIELTDDQVKELMTALPLSEQNGNRLLVKFNK